MKNIPTFQIYSEAIVFCISLILFHTKEKGNRGGEILCENERSRRVVTGIGHFLLLKIKL